MSWFKVDDGFSEHPKLEALEDEPEKYLAAVTVWVVMGADCARRTEDGRVSRARLRKVLGFLGDAVHRGAEALVEVQLWERDEAGDGYIFHDWADYQPTRAQVATARDKRNMRQQRWRKRDDGVDAPVDASVDGAVDASHAAPVDASLARAIPARPGPARPGGERAPRARHPPRREACAERETQSLERAFDHMRLGAVFRELVLRAWLVEPSLSWRGAAAFAESVCRTAAAQGRDPEELFRSVLASWLRGAHNERERATPLPCFAEDFPELALRLHNANGAHKSIEEIRAELAGLVTPKQTGWTA